MVEETARPGSLRAAQGGGAQSEGVESSGYWLFRVMIGKEWDGEEQVPSLHPNLSPKLYF